MRKTKTLCSLFAFAAAVAAAGCAAGAPADDDSLRTGADPLTATLVARGSTWRYLDDGTNQGTAWRAASFDDSTWRSGPAELGYGDGDERTVVSYGPNASNKYITTYFRRAFDVADPSGFSALTLSLRRDDGAVVYLNGVEVFRSNMPSGTVTYTTLAFDAANETRFYATTVPASALRAGSNLVAVEVHQADASSSDISFDMDLVATVADADAGVVADGGSGGTPTSIVTRGSTWRYLDNGSDQGTAWRASSFDDSSWRSGASELGYGDGDERTVVSYGPDSSNKYITTYFRRAFDVANPSAYSSLTLGIRRDDGAVVYLNGAEIFRTSMPAGTVTYTTRAADAGSETMFYTTSVAPSGLAAGRNVLAVEVHQSEPTSSDISFDLELLGTLGSSFDAGTAMDAGVADSGAADAGAADAGAGSDAGSGTDAGPPAACTRSLAAGGGNLATFIAGLSAGDVACLSGTFTLSSILQIRNGGYTLRSADGVRARIVGQVELYDSADDVTIDAIDFAPSSATSFSVVYIWADRVTLRNVDISGGSTRNCLEMGYGVESDSGAWAEDVLIERSRLHHCGDNNHEHAIYAEFTRRLVVRDSYLYACAGYGLHFYPQAEHTLVEYSVIDGNATSSDYASNVVFAGERAGGEYSSAHGSRYNVIRYSLITFPAQHYNLDSYYPSGSLDPVGNEVSFSCVFGAPSGDFGGSSAYSQHDNVHADPLYVNRAAYDYRLQTSSPCRGWGPR